jgi:hypothetical protein
VKELNTRSFFGSSSIVCGSNTRMITRRGYYIIVTLSEEISQKECFDEKIIKCGDIVICGCYMYRQNMNTYKKRNDS